MQVFRRSKDQGSLPPRTSLRRPALSLAAGLIGLALAGQAQAATCGNTGAGFAAWKTEFAQEAAANGVGKAGLAALSKAQYNTKTIAADRNQKGVKYPLNEFIRIRLGSLDSFGKQGRAQKAKNPGFYTSLERAYGVPAGILIAIHGMETAWGKTMGSVPVVDSILTVAYDCRRADFFTPHAIAALQMVDRGMLSTSQLGAFHGELGHTQFLPGNALRYGVDADGDGKVNLYGISDALATTAAFLKAKGWQAGQPYQEGTANFRVLNEWNAATVYQQAIALAAAKIDG